MQQLIVFEVGQHQFAFKASAVVEIIRAVEVTALPRPNPPFIGVINYRGTVVPVVRMSDLFGLNSRVTQINEQMIIASDSTLPLVCLIVDQVIAFASAELLQPASEAGQIQPQRTITAELARLETRLVPIINLPTLLSGTHSVIRTDTLPEASQFNEN
jgi:chemotaxis signal transduction protein